MTPTIHVVDDDESFLRSMERRLRGHGYTVATYPSVARFFKRPDPEKPGCVLADLQMPTRDGFDLQETLAKSNNPLPVVFVTGKGDIPTSVRAMRAGAEDFLTKRAATADLVAAIDRAIGRNARERTVKYHRTMLTRRLDIYASVDLTRLVQDAGITIEELGRMAYAGTPVRGRSK